MSERRYRDTAADATRYLADASNLDLTDAIATPDPQVEGVWKVTTPNHPDVDFAIVYLAGYKDPFGRVREVNDFETCG